MYRVKDRIKRLLYLTNNEPFSKVEKKQIFLSFNRHDMKYNPHVNTVHTVHATTRPIAVRLKIRHKRIIIYY